MAAGFNPTFGDGENQYCAEPCQHKDCAAARAFVAEPCVTCGKPLGTEGRFYRAENGEGHEHSKCTYARLDGKPTPV